jgi:hypothetical protein
VKLVMHQSGLKNYNEKINIAVLELKQLDAIGRTFEQVLFFLC